MGKIHLLFKKEEVDEGQMKGKVAVVFDVLLATSTITTGLYYGAKEVVPVLDHRHAQAEAKDRDKNSYVLVGEYRGKTIEGFLDPTPLTLRGKVEDKTMILSTTNGTVAINKAREATRVYIAAMINGKKVAEKINSDHRDDEIMIICSGSSGEFCIEDFYGAGYFIDCILANQTAVWKLSDAARAAYYFFKGQENNGEDVLGHSRVGQMLLRNSFAEEVSYVARQGILSIVPYLKDEGHVVIKEENEFDRSREKH
ncbi:2-phosphosulfolactate phosphatase [Desertibacillus haloalkaliphilus]|uniref:2-phosphosulfolactate phosphatase n=1 Tax=Desertibacillus haloalkaliphilus TaxID=1328930 RepID=UPI001C27DD41|nr:2-phosphosulfolactate phosphatase [Desertibacillus haloalkaliphilus]MBU8905648.1 2-phosphosulfolactate phosphatase [Desertibacillus haloalkaliphilus]